MNVLITSGTVTKVIYRSESVVIFIVKTATKRAEHLRIKMFQKTDPDNFPNVQEGAYVSVQGHLSNQKYEKPGEAPTYVTEGVVDEITLVDLKPVAPAPPARPMPEKVEPLSGPTLPWSTK